MLVKFLCDSITAFGLPVVPDVKISDATAFDMHFRRQKRDPLRLFDLGRHFENVFECPDRRAFELRRRFRAWSVEVRIFLREVSGSETIAEASPALREIHDLVDRARRVDRDRRRARFQNAEIGHSPFGHIVRKQDDAVALLDAFVGKETRGAQASVLSHPRRCIAPFGRSRSIRIATRVGKRLDRRVEKIEQVLVGVGAPLLDLQLFFERRQHPFAHAREMDV